MKKRFFSLFCAIILLSSCIPMTHAVPVGIYIDDKQVTTKNAADILGDGTATYDISAATLTLQGVRAKTITTSGDLCLKLKADNALETIHIGGDLSILGDGVLTLRATDKVTAVALKCNNLTVGESAKLDATAAKASERSNAIWVNDDVILKEQASVSVKSGNALLTVGICCGYIEMRDKASLTATSGNTSGYGDVERGAYIDPPKHLDHPYGTMGVCSSRFQMYGGSMTASCGKASHPKANNAVIYGAKPNLHTSYSSYATHIVSEKSDGSAAKRILDFVHQPDGHSKVQRYVKVYPCTGDQFCYSAKYKDVYHEKWYHNGVDHAIKYSRMIGLSDTIFDPDGYLTREQFVTILWRSGIAQDYGTESPFTDVDPNRYSAKAIVWAYEECIIEGVSKTSFAPQEPLTREQMATIFYRYFDDVKNFNGVPKLSKYEDCADVSDFARKPMRWAVYKGWIQGTKENVLDPQGYTTRAQLATILLRMYSR